MGLMGLIVFIVEYFAFRKKMSHLWADFALK